MSSKKDPRIRAFLRQAMPVIAASGGLNELSRERLHALAENLRLTDAEWREAWSDLVAAESHRELLTRYELAFAKHLRRELRKLQDRILPLKVENRAIHLAEARYQVGEVRARQILERECKRLNITRISRSDAEDYVEHVVIHELEDQREPDPTQLQRLYAFAKQWGVRRDVVDAFVDEAIADNVRGWQRLERLSLAWQRIWLLALFAVVALGIGVYLIYTSHAKQRPRGTTEHPNATEPVQKHIWWPDAELATLLDAIEIDVPWRNQVLAMAEQPAHARSTAYQLVWSRALDSSAPAEKHALAEILALLARADPEAPPSDTWLDQMIAQSYNPSLTTVREVELARKISCWDFVAELAMLWDAADGEPDTLPSAALARLVREQLIPNLAQMSPTEIRSAVRTALMSEHWQLARQTMSANPNQSALQMIWLRQLNDLSERPDWGLRLHSRSILEYIQTLPQNWIAVQSELESAIQHATDLEWMEWLRVHLSASTPPELVHSLNRPLLDRLHDSRSGLSQSEIDRVLYVQYVELRRLQHDGLLIGFERLQRAVAQQAANSNPQPAELPEFIARWARLSNDALAIVQAVTSGNSVQAADTLGVPDLNPLGFTAPRPGDQRDPRAKQATPADYRALAESLALLDLRDAESAGLRRSALNQLAGVSARLDDVGPEDGARLADYYLYAWEPEEWLHAEKLAPQFIAWPQFLLALGQAVDRGAGDVDHATTLAQLAAGREVELSRDEPWRQTLSRMLWQQALLAWRRKISMQPDSAVADWQRIPALVARYYRQRATQLGRGAWPDPAEPSEVVAAATSLSSDRRLVAPSGLRRSLAGANEMQTVWLALDWFLREQFDEWAERLPAGDARNAIQQQREAYDAALVSQPSLARALLLSESSLCALYQCVAEELIQTHVLVTSNLRPYVREHQRIAPRELDTPASVTEHVWPVEIAQRLSQLRVEQWGAYRDLAEEIMLSEGGLAHRDLAIRLYLIAARQGSPALRASCLRGLIAAARSGEERLRFEQLAALHDDATAAAPSASVLADSERMEDALRAILVALSRNDRPQARRIWFDLDPELRQTGWNEIASSRDIQTWCESDVPLADTDRYRIVQWLWNLEVNPDHPAAGLHHDNWNWALLAPSAAPVSQRLPTFGDVTEFNPNIRRFADGRWTR